MAPARSCTTSAPTGPRHWTAAAASSPAGRPARHRRGHAQLLVRAKGHGPPGGHRGRVRVVASLRIRWRVPIRTTGPGPAARSRPVPSPRWSPTSRPTRPDRWADPRPGQERTPDRAQPLPRPDHRRVVALPRRPPRRPLDDVEATRRTFAAHVDRRRGPARPRHVGRPANATAAPARSRAAVARRALGPRRDETSRADRRTVIRSRRIRLLPPGPGPGRLLGATSPVSAPRRSEGAAARLRRPGAGAEVADDLGGGQRAEVARTARAGSPWV